MPFDIASLKRVGLLNWQRRSKPIESKGDFLLTQDTNAYAVRPTSQWRGFDFRSDAYRLVC